MKLSAFIEACLPPADVYSDERAKDLLMSLKLRLGAQALSTICLRLEGYGLRLLRAPVLIDGHGRCSTMEFAFVTDQFCNIANSLEKVFEFYDCALYSVSYSQRTPKESMDYGYRSRHLVSRHFMGHLMEVVVVLTLPY